MVFCWIFLFRSYVTQVCSAAWYQGNRDGRCQKKIWYWYHSDNYKTRLLNMYKRNSNNLLRVHTTLGILALCTVFYVHVNPNPQTVPLIPNRYGKRGACTGLSPSPTPSTRPPISHWWALWVSVVCLGHVLRGGDGPGGGWGAGRGGMWEA